MSATASTFTVRHVQLVRALFAAAAAAMITFSSDHSAAIGLSVFSGFAIASALVLTLSAWLVFPAGARWPYVLLAAVSFIAGMAGSFPVWRTNDLFFVAVITWGLLAGVIELIAGLRARRAGEATARDSITVGVFGILLGLALLAVPAGFSEGYAIASQSGTLTGIIVGVGLFGGYAAIVAVFLGIAGLTPKRADAVATASDTELAAPGGER